SGAETAAGPLARVEFWRAGRLETAHRVSVVVCDTEGRLQAHAGDAGLRTFWRSAAKPFQLLPFVVAGGPAAYGLGPRELAVMAASHNGEEPHRAAAGAILAAAGFREADLLCGAHAPLEEHGWRELAAAAGPPSPLWNNCSGKHAGMLAHCRLRGWPAFDYRSPAHPLQREIVQAVERAAGEMPAAGPGIDGCGVPVFHLSLTGMATAYARLGGGNALPEEWQEASGSIVRAMVEEPFYLAGTGRLCTTLPALAGERVVAKVGAGGIFCATLRGRGWGLALKVEDGSSTAAAVALLEALRQLDVLSHSEVESLTRFPGGRIRNHAGTPVGRVEVRFSLA
ncbi:MAG: asparaginase, partial [Gemmatimonadetes bacterium]|nr:asparaginase [Gemmatimonadota bacterium]